MSSLRLSKLTVHSILISYSLSDSTFYCNSSINNDHSILFNQKLTSTMPDRFKELYKSHALLIRSFLQSRSRQVEKGCIFKIPFSKFYSGHILKKNISHLYGIVGEQCDYCNISTATAYDVTYFLEGVDIPNGMLSILYQPLYDNEMIIVRFPEQSSCLDDPNVE